MVTYLPISSPFIRFAGRYVDEAFGVAAGYNFFIFEAALVPFEVTAINMIINFWSDAVPVAGIIAIVLVLYMCVLSCRPPPAPPPPNRIIGLSILPRIQITQHLRGPMVRRSRVLACSGQGPPQRRTDSLHLHRHARWEPARGSIRIQILE